MGLIKRADFEDYTRDAYVMDLTDLEKRGRAVIDAANTQAQKILEDAQAQREKLIATAHQEGYEQGLREGIEKGHTDGSAAGIEEARAAQTQLLDQLTQMWATQLDAFDQHRDLMLEQARTQVVELGAMIASRVTRRVVELDPTIVVKQIEAALSSVTESTRLVISVHPDDIEHAQAELPALIERFSTCEHAQLITDATIETGSCIARTSTGGIIDASISTQLDRILDAMIPTGMSHRDDTSELGIIGIPENSDPIQSVDEDVSRENPKDDAA